MSIQLSIPQILQIAKLCQPLTVVDSHTKMVYQGGDLNMRQARLIYMERVAVQNRYNLNPNDPTLRDTSNYLFSLLRNWPAAQNMINAIGGGLAVITGPSNASVNVGDTATFTIGVTSSSVYTIQWYKNGSPIAGATSLSYSLVNAQLTDSGDSFYAIVTNGAGPSPSLTASLTVTAALQAKWWFGDTDPFPDLSGGSDTLDYQITQNITHNAPIVIDYSGQTGAENNQFNVLRYPNTENDKTTWINTGFNQGNIPDSVMHAILNINGFKYVISRNAMNLDAITTTMTYS